MCNAVIMHVVLS